MELTSNLKSDASPGHVHQPGCERSRRREDNERGFEDGDWRAIESGKVDGDGLCRCCCCYYVRVDAATMLLRLCTRLTSLDQALSAEALGRPNRMRLRSSRRHTHTHTESVCGAER